MHQTRVRPRTEPYDIWCARRKMQQKALKEYLKGRVIWTSCVTVDTRKGTDRVRPPRKKDLKKVKVQGTYVAPRCSFCNEKEKRCQCWRLINE